MGEGEKGENKKVFTSQKVDAFVRLHVPSSEQNGHIKTTTLQAAALPIYEMVYKMKLLEVEYEQS